MLASATLAAVAQPAATPERDPEPIKLDIPAAFHGMWVQEPSRCLRKIGPGLVVIEPRRMTFSESVAYLNMGQLNHRRDPPDFVGEFSFAGELDFWRQVVRLELEGQLLAITEVETPRDDSSGERWTRCSSTLNLDHAR